MNGINTKKLNHAYQKITQFLVMTLDRKLNWKGHIDRLWRKAKKTLNTIKVTACKKQEETRKPYKNYTIQYVDQSWTITANYTARLPQNNKQKLTAYTGKE